MDSLSEISKAQAYNIAMQLGERLDDRQTAILARALEYVKARTYDIKYPGLMARRFIPVSNEVPNGAESVTYRQWDEYGMAKVIANAADDLPMVDILANEYTSPIKSLGDSYTYSVQDLRAAALSGVPLDARKAAAARRAIEAAIDEVAALGIAGTPMRGLLNHPNVPIVAPDNGSWAAASAEDILADMNKLASAVASNTRNVHNPDTLLLPTAAFARAASLGVGTSLDKTVLRVFLDTNPYIKNVDQWHRLDTAGIGGTPRAIAYLRDPEVLEMEIHQEFEQFPPQARNPAFVVPCHARVGGVVVRYPLGAAYMDGL